VFFNPYQSANQYFYQGQMLIQQAVTAESGGYGQPALQMYDNAVQNILYSMQLASQAGCMIPDHIFYTLSWAYFQGARLRLTFGDQMAISYFAYALQAINQALAINPTQFQHHALAGSILMMQGDINNAEVAFSHARNLNPMDGYSNWMLAYINQMRGSQTNAQSYFSTAHAANPDISAVPGQEASNFNPVNSQEQLRTLVSEVVQQYMQSSNQTSLWQQPNLSSDYSTAPTSASILDKWKAKLSFLQLSEVTVTDPSQKFKLQEEIKEAKQKIKELEA
jgi:tetratricopeptide (TPR) repeat protein